MLGKIPAARLALIEKIAAQATRSVAASQRRLTTEFIRGFFRGVSEDDLRLHAPRDLAAAALSHLDFGRVRNGKQALVGLAPALAADEGLAAHRALVRVVSPDMPFLVDSIGIVFSSMNIGVHLIVHPVLHVRRDARGRLREFTGQRAAPAESWQLIEIDRPADEAQARELLRRLHGALEDVRKAVGDFRAMLERVRAVANELERAPSPVPRSHAAEARALLSWMHDGHVVFLGYRHYQLKRGRSRDVLVRDPDSGLGILRGSRGRNQAPIVLTGEMRSKAREADLLVLTKANTPSTVHRASYLDYVGV
jgi:glutamate dehydrogenase